MFRFNFLLWSRDMISGGPTSSGKGSDAGLLFTIRLRTMTSSENCYIKQLVYELEISIA